MMAEHLNIGLFTDTYTPTINGVVTSVRGLEATLRSLGHTVTIVAPTNPEQTSPETHVIRLRSARYRPIPEHRMALIPSPRKLLQLRRCNFDVIHTHGTGPLPVIGLFLSRAWEIPLLHTYHTRMQDYFHYYPWYPLLASLSSDNKWYITPRAAGRLRRSLDRSSLAIGEWFDAWFANRCDHILTPTAIIARELQDKGVKTPVSVVPNGIHLEGLRLPQPDPLPQLAGCKRLLTVSRLGKEKSVDVLLGYFATLQTQLPESHLLIVGDGPERSALEQLASSLGIAQKVTFVGYVAPQNISAYYQHSDVFVFASVTETQGLVTLEAQACGLAVVARAGGGVVSTVQQGITGFVIDPNNENSFVEAVLAVLSSPKERFAQAARDWTDQEGSLTTMAARALKCYAQARENFQHKLGLDLD